MHPNGKISNRNEFWCMQGKQKKEENLCLLQFKSKSSSSLQSKQQICSTLHLCFSIYWIPQLIQYVDFPKCSKENIFHAFVYLLHNLKRWTYSWILMGVFGSSNANFNFLSQKNRPWNIQHSCNVLLRSDAAAPRKVCHFLIYVRQLLSLLVLS